MRIKRDLPIPYYPATGRIIIKFYYTNIIYYTYIVRVMFFLLDKNEIDEGVAQTGPECHCDIDHHSFFFFLSTSLVHMHTHTTLTFIHTINITSF